MNHVVDDELRVRIQTKLKSTFKKTIDNPVIKAQMTWKVLSEQLEALLGHEIHKQWFQNVRPIVLKNNILLLQTESHFAAQWINTHYQQLADALIIIQDRKYTCFFISPKNFTKNNYLKAPDLK